MRRAAVITAMVLATAAGALAQGDAGPGDGLRTPERYRRAVGQTYLTFPEWFLVFSPEEYADLVEHDYPSRFPFLRHVAQVWTGYLGIASEVPEGTPTDPTYHGMVWIIAGSTTIEYGVRAVYESVIGRVTEATVIGETTAEDRFGAEVAREYERFLRQAAWYDYDYADALRRLWTEVPFTWSSPIRALERRYALTSEYVFKLAYAQVLRSASQAAWEGDDFSNDTVVVLDGEPEGVPFTLIERHADGQVLGALPRYEAFTAASGAVAAQGVSFVEIAGNTGPILVSVRAPTGYTPPGARVVLRQPILTQQGKERVVVEVRVGELSALLRALADADGVSLEHVYDY